MNRGGGELVGGLFSFTRRFLEPFETLIYAERKVPSQFVPVDMLLVVLNDIVIGCTSLPAQNSCADFHLR